MAVTAYKLLYGTGTATVVSTAPNLVDGGFYAVINVNGSVYFGRGEVNEEEVSTGANLPFLAYYDDDMVFQWVRQVSSQAGVGEVVADPDSGNAGIHGYALTGATIATGQTGEVTAGANSLYLAVWDVAGDFDGAAVATTAEASPTPRAAVGVPGGGFIVFGTFGAVLTFDPTGTPVVLTAGSTNNGYLARYDGSMALLWARNVLAGTGTRQRAECLAINPGDGHVLMTGGTRGNLIGAVDDPGRITITLGGNDSAFSAEFNVSDGSVVWAKGTQCPRDDNADFSTVNDDGTLGAYYARAELTTGAKSDMTFGLGETFETTLSTVTSVAVFDPSNGNILNVHRHGAMVVGTTPTGGFLFGNGDVRFTEDGMLAISGSANGPILCGGIAREMGDIQQSYLSIIDPNDPTKVDTAALYVIPASALGSTNNRLARLGSGDLVWFSCPKGNITVAEGSDIEDTFSNGTTFVLFERINTVQPALPVPVDRTVTVKAAGGDYTTIAAAVAAELTNTNLVSLNRRLIIESYINTVEDITLGTGARTDAYRRAIICAGAYGVDDAYKHGGRLFGGVTMYGRVTMVEETYATISDMTLLGDPTGNAVTNDVTAGPVNLKLERCIISTQAGVGVYARNPSPASLTHVNQCLFEVGLGVTTNHMTADSTGIATTKVTNVLMNGGGRGFQRVAGSSTVRNSYAFDTSTADFAGTVTDGGGNASQDGSLGTTTDPTTADFVARRSSILLAAGDFDEAPADAPGKIARACVYRYAGSRVGTLGGDAALASGLLTGTTGGLIFAEAAITSLNSMVLVCKGTMPAAPTSRALVQTRATADSFNRATLSITSDGSLTFQVWDNAGSQAPGGSILQYMPGADELAGTHVYAGRIHGGDLYIYLDGAVVAGPTAYAGTRDDTDSHQLYIGTTGSVHIGASASLSSFAQTTGAAAPVTVPLSYVDDGSGMLNDFDLTWFSPLFLQRGGAQTDNTEPDIKLRPTSSVYASVGPFSAYERLFGFSINGYGTFYYGAGLDAGLDVIGNRKPLYGS